MTRRPAMLLAAAWVLAALAPALLALLLLGIAATPMGRVFALDALALLALPVLALRSLVVRRARALGAVAAVAAGLYGVLAWNAPSGLAPGTPGVSQRFGAGHPMARYGLPNLLPEVDQLQLGLVLAPWADPYTTRARAEAVRRHTVALYRAQDPSLASLGSVLGHAYLDLDGGHAFVFVPEVAVGEKVPLLLFLHGSGGNFRSYFGLLLPWARAHHVALVSPTFGFGDWHHPGGVEAIAAARAWAIDTLPVDGRRVVLMGLSNGGRGVSRAAAARPDDYAALAFLSGVIEDEVVATPQFLKAWSGRPMLVLYGAEDERIDARWVEQTVATLEQAGVQVHAGRRAGRDHFLWFDEQDQVAAELDTFWRDLRF